MSATVKGTANTAFGFASAETGVLIQSLEIRNSVEKAELRNEQGAVAGLSMYNPTSEVTGEAGIAGSTGVAAAVPAAALTLANYTPAAGLILVEETTFKQTATGFKTISFKAVVYPLITS